MNKLVTFASVALLTAAAAQVQAATYNVTGSFTYSTPGATNHLSTSLGAGNILTGGTINVGGTVTTDSTSAGYNITGGNLTMTGSMQMAPTGIPITIAMNMASTSANNNGTVFNSGSICVSATGVCDAGLIDVSATNISFQNGALWGYQTAKGLQLTGGAGGASFTVAQPGAQGNAGVNLTKAAGAATLLGNAAGIFLGGNLTFTEVAEVPVPAAAWLFGSALLGLGGVARRRRKS